MNCRQSAILSLAFGVWVEPTFSEVDVYVERTVLLQALHGYNKQKTWLKKDLPLQLSLLSHLTCSFTTFSQPSVPTTSIQTCHNRSLLHPRSRSPLGCPFLCSVRNSHPHSPLCSSLHTPGPCGTKTVLLCCWSLRRPPPGTSTRRGPAGTETK